MKQPSQHALDIAVVLLFAVSAILSSSTKNLYGVILGGSLLIWYGLVMIQRELRELRRERISAMAVRVVQEMHKEDTP